MARCVLQTGSVLLQVEGAVLLLDEHAGLDQLRDELLRALRRLELALGVVELALQVADALVLVVE